jgi:hypothetical protein
VGFVACVCVFNVATSMQRQLCFLCNLVCDRRFTTRGCRQTLTYPSLSQPPSCVCTSAHTYLRVSWRVKGSAAIAGLHTSKSIARQRQRRNSRACPCGRLFNDRVCALQRLHTSNFIARQRQRRDGRAYLSEHVFSPQVCVLQRIHTSNFVAHQRQLR